VFSFAYPRTSPTGRRGLVGRRAKTCTLYLRSMDIGLAPGAVVASPALMSLVLADLEWCVRAAETLPARRPWWRTVGRRRHGWAIDGDLAADRERLCALADTVVRDAC
jgi:hypothetical protein